MGSFLVYVEEGDSQEAARAYLKSAHGAVRQLYVERDLVGRPQLQIMLNRYRREKVPILIGALGSLGRSFPLLHVLWKSKAKFVCADIPNIDEKNVGNVLFLIDHERQRRSERAREGAAKARARGVKLGGDRGALTPSDRKKGTATSIEVRRAKARDRAAEIAPAIADLREAGKTSLAAMAAGLNQRGVLAPNGGCWSPTQVRRVLSLFEE